MKTRLWFTYRKGFPSIGTCKRIIMELTFILVAVYWLCAVWSIIDTKFRDTDTKEKCAAPCDLSAVEIICVCLHYK